jgi:hypothetical protein
MAGGLSGYHAKAQLLNKKKHQGLSDLDARIRGKPTK